MNRKQSHDVTTNQNSTQPKVRYQLTSPYIELLESKKSQVYGHRYDTKNIRSLTNYVKPASNSITSIFSQKPKHIKTSSNQKNKGLSYDKKKRNRTEQAEDKMHESMCIYPSTVQRNQDDHTCKSLFYPEAKIDRSKDVQQAEQASNKNKRKRHLSENKYSYHDQDNVIRNVNLLGNLKVVDIDSLIALIDNCVNQANDYISYLSGKLATMKQQLLISKSQIAQLEERLTKKCHQFNEQSQIIKQIQRQAFEHKDHKKQSSFQIKNLLEIIEKLSEQNERLRKENSEKLSMNNKIDKHMEKYLQHPKEKDSRIDYFNEIHGKIDILNISIDNNHNYHEGISQSDTKEKDRETAKKYKFIKPKKQ